MPLIDGAEHAFATYANGQGLQIDFRNNTELVLFSRVDPLPELVMVAMYRQQMVNTSGGGFEPWTAN